MKYGTTLIVLAVVNILTIFSGVPTGWKKIIILITSACLIALGWMMRTVAKRRARKIHDKAEAIELAAHEEIAQIANKISHDVTHKVEDEIDRL